MERFEALEKALALIDRPGGWTQGALCREADGGIKFPDQPGFSEADGYAYCAIGAVAAVCAGDEILKEDCVLLLDLVALRRFKVGVESVNDGGGVEADYHPRDAAFDRVRTVFQEAIRVTKAAVAAATAVPVADGDEGHTAIEQVGVG